MWWARSAEFTQRGIKQTLRWLRVIGDTIFGVGALVLEAPPAHPPPGVPLRQARDRWFVEGAEEIATWLAHVHGTGMPH